MRNDWLIALLLACIRLVVRVVVEVNMWGNGEIRCLCIYTYY